MMGRQKDEQGQFFYEFDLDEVAPAEHPVRQVDAVLDLSWVHKELAPYYSHTGRPSVDPVYLRGGAGQSGLSMVLQARYRGQDTRSFDLQPPPARALPRERHLSPGVLRGGGDVHRGRPGWRRRVLDRCEPDPGGCGQE
jgi:hypothetical protein